MHTVSVRYIVSDVDATLQFYTTHLGFGVDLHPGPGFAAVSRGNLRLLLSKPGGGGGAGQPMLDGREPKPGGWNRIQIQFSDLVKEVDKLRTAGVRCRSGIVIGNGGKQILIEDPSGNPVELLEPAK